MKATIMKGAVLTTSLLLFFGHVLNSSRAASRAGAGASSKTSQAKALFEERCARCHGRDGRGQTRLGEMLSPPDFTDAEWQKRATDERMSKSVRDGVGEMPAFKRKLSRREIAALVAYVRGFAKPSR